MIVALFPELLHFGGVQLAGRQIAAATCAIAEERGWRFHALSLNDAGGEHESNVGRLKFQFYGFGRGKLQFIFAALRAALAKPGIIIASHPNLAPLASGMRLLSRNSRIIIFTHGIEVWRPLSFIRRHALRQANVVIAPSTDTAGKLSGVQRVQDNRILKLPWPLDPDFLALANESGMLLSPESFPRGLVVLSVGRWAASERYKGADFLIQAVAGLAAEFPDLRLVLAGSGDDIPRLQEIARNSGHAPRIHFLTNLPREALAACYAKADIFALPSSGEGFGFVFLEAMAMKKPVIGTALGGIPDIVRSGETGIFVDPENPTSLVAALRELLSSPDLRKRMGGRGSELVRTRFSFEGFQNELRSVLSAEK